MISLVTYLLTKQCNKILTSNIFSCHTCIQGNWFKNTFLHIDAVL